MKTQAPVINIKPYEQNKQHTDATAQTQAPATSKTENSIEGERIQKVLARGGVGSRREVERWITEGLLILNGQPAKLGERLKAGDDLSLKGRPLKWEKFGVQPTRVLIYHKPTGEVVTRHDPEDRPVVFKKLPKLQTGRWIAIGRLDINTQGLLLFTNNGELANRLMHPSFEIDREYAVRVLGEVTEDHLAQLKKGMPLEDGLAKFDDIQFNGGEGANRWYHVTVKEGRNRLVRRLWEALEFKVSRLMRVRYGPVFLPDGLGARQTHELTAQELDDLLSFVDLPSERFSQAAKPGRQTKPRSKPQANIKSNTKDFKRKEERKTSDKKSSFNKNKRPRR